MLNQQVVETTLPPGMVALDFIRQQQRLTGTKESCREGECGSCSVLLGHPRAEGVEYKAVASCLLPLGELDGKHMVTIEGLNGEKLTPVQQALVDHGGVQCGYCTPGFVISLTDYFLGAGAYDPVEALAALDGNICRCTGYVSIRRCIDDLCRRFAPLLDTGKPRVPQLIEWGMLPAYFLDIPDQIKSLLPSAPKAIRQIESESLIVAGTTDLMIQVPGKLLRGPLEFVSGMDQLTGITEEHNQVILGAAVTMEEFKISPLLRRLFPGHDEYMKRVASRIIRNRATLAGNIVNASPIADVTIFLLPLQTRLLLVSENSQRQVPLERFYKAYKEMDLQAGEILQTITFPKPSPTGLFNFEKVARRKYLDIAACNSAIYLEVRDRMITRVGISAGGVAPIPLLLKATTQFLEGKPIEGKTIQTAAGIMQEEIAPISDVRGSADYKRLLLRQLFYAHFLVLFPDFIKAEELL